MNPNDPFDDKLDWLDWLIAITFCIIVLLLILAPFFRILYSLL